MLKIMGTYEPAFLVILAGKPELDEFISESRGMLVKVHPNPNGYVNYFLGYHGYKTTNPDAEFFDKFREKLIAKAKELELDWYEIKENFDHAVFRSHLNPDQYVNQSTPQYNHR